MNTIEAIIFDLDGTLVDSEPLQFQAFNEAFSQHGKPATPAEYDQWRHWEVIPRWIESRGLSLHPDSIRAVKKSVYDRLIREKITLKPGARELVETASAHFRLAVASGSRRDSIMRCLNKFALLERFETLCSTSEVGHGKPHPGVFIETARKMSIPPAKAVAIEDSVTGLKAAKSAGMACIVCPDQFLPAPRSLLRTADLIVDSLEDLTVEKIKQLAPGK